MFYKEYTTLVRVYDDRLEFLDPNTKELHFEDGPAIRYNNGNFVYYRQGHRHNDKGPAQVWVYPNIDKNYRAMHYCKNGLLHRENGPAFITENEERYFLNGKELSQREFEQEIKKRNNCLEGKIIEIDGKKYRLTEVE